MTVAKIEIPEARLGELCRRHGIRRLGLFGSVLTGRFSDPSDIDVLVEFRPEERVGSASEPVRRCPVHSPTIAHFRRPEASAARQEARATRAPILGPGALLAAAPGFGLARPALVSAGNMENARAVLGLMVRHRRKFDFGETSALPESPA